MPTSPFTIATDAAARLKTPMASVGILSAVAAAQIDAGLIDDAFVTVAKIPATSDQRSFLLNSAINAANNLKIDVVLRLVKKLVEVDSESSVVAGRLAQIFLENNEPDAAIKIVNSIDKPFDSWRSRCEFAIKLLDFDVDVARGIIETINDVDYRSWGVLALAQKLARSGDFDAAVKVADNISQPLRRAWALFELGKLSKSADGELRFFEMSASILSVVNIDAQNAESFATAFRIIGKFAYNSGKSKNNEKNINENIDNNTDENVNENADKIMAIGESFLEASESAAMIIPVPVQRLRAQLFLAGTLLELGLIDGVGTYIDRREIENKDFSEIEQSKVWQWSAESDPRLESDWTSSVEAVSIAQRKSEELGLAERMSEVIRRFATRNNKSNPTGKPNEDSINLSARQFEEHYYSPFAIEGCNC
ncbi:MAG: hypothetical protein LBK06_05345 [Planctomycetaceae bacterium]|jgi:hypothetical protein|nr:hypothetical protein [Planctomycetaceae bacterium]